jgi:hypothetical protein
MLQIGYFARPGMKPTKVHIVDENREPLCKIRISAEAEFLWCSSEIILDYVQCDRCRATYLRKLQEEVTNVQGQIGENAGVHHGTHH